MLELREAKRYEAALQAAGITVRLGAVRSTTFLLIYTPSAAEEKVGFKEDSVICGVRMIYLVNGDLALYINAPTVAGKSFTHVLFSVPDRTWYLCTNGERLPGTVTFAQLT